MVFQWSLSDRKTPKVSRTFLSILADLNNAVAWMVSTCPLIFKSYSPFTKSLGLFRAHQLQLESLSSVCSIVFSSFSWKVLVSISLFAFFYFYMVVCRNDNVPYSADYIFCWLGLVVCPRLGDLFIFHNPREVHASHSSRRILTVTKHWRIHWLS